MPGLNTYGRVAAFVRAWKAGQQRDQQSSGRGTFVPLVFVPGEAFQFDWSEDWAIIAGKQTRLQVAHTKLSHSRAFIVRAYPLQTHEILFDALTQAFRVLGGVPQRGIFDNMRTAVDRIGSGKARQINARFAAMASHYLFEPEFCNPASGWEKGQVEKNVQDTRRRLWYSVPASFANQRVSLRIYPDRIVVAAEGRFLCEHGRIIDRTHPTGGRTIYDWRHYLAVIQRKPGALRNGAPFIELPQAFRQLQGYLLKRLGGDREMVEILSLVLHHDEQAVLRAVELALEAGVPTKTHVLNILHRLTDGKAPPVAPMTAPQALRLVQEPVADDNLREVRHAS